MLPHFGRDMRVYAHFVDPAQAHQSADTDKLYLSRKFRYHFNNGKNIQEFGHSSKSSDSITYGTIPAND